MRFILALFLLLSIIPVSAKPIFLDYKVVIDAMENNIAKQDIYVVLKNPDNESMTSLNFSLGNFRNLLTENITYSDDEWHLQEALKPGETTSFHISFLSDDIISNIGNERIFLAYFPMPFETERFSLILLLPKGYFISDATKVFPEPEFFSDKGERIMLVWRKENPNEFQASARFLPIIVEKERIVQFPFFRSEWILPGIILAFFFGYFLGAGAMSAIIQLIRKGISPSLSEEEQRIINLLEKGERTQARIQDELGFSKAKLSRLLRSMEERNLIVRQTKGRTNLVRLK